MDRRTLGSWLTTPGQAPEALSKPQDYRGQRLGLPALGPGSISSVGRRMLAVVIDWIAALLVTGLVTPWGYGEGDYGLVALGIFFLEVTVFTWISGASFGQRIVGIQVMRVTGERVSLWRCALRTALLSTVIPALIWDADTRGLHDKSVGTVCVRRVS